MLGLVQVTLQWILFSIVYVPLHPTWTPANISQA
jgi:hypothetical protein